MAIDLVAPPWTEQDFARAVEALDPHDAVDRAELVSFLDERHAVHRQRGAAAVGRMRGWTLLALAKAPLRGDEVMFVLEELQSGRTAYELACAARALRGVASPTPAMAGLVLRAASNLRATDDHVDLTRYGGLADDGTDAPTAMDALMDTLAWLCTTVPGTAGVLASALRSGDPPLSTGQRDRVERCLAHGLPEQQDHPLACCTFDADWSGLRRWCSEASLSTNAITFEDQDGNPVGYADFFRGGPTVVVFFYTRCNNAGKCSLSVSKLARIQRLLADKGLAQVIQTAAITYDPDYDLAPRLRGYAESRGMCMDARNRVMRTTSGADELHAHFQLGVNFIDSIVNRHRIEAFVVDARGRISASFVRLQWNEEEVVAEAVAAVDRAAQADSHESVTHQPDGNTSTPTRRSRLQAWLAPPIYLAMALLPKCPICGATYLSLSGILALPHLDGIYWMMPALMVLTIVNLAGLGWLARATRDWRGLALGWLGATVTLGCGIALEQPAGLYGGIAISLIGCLAARPRRGRPCTVR